MNRADVLRILFESCNYDAVLAAPRPTRDEGAGAMLRVRSLIELQRFDEAIAEADAALTAPAARTGDLLAAKARAASFLNWPLHEIERLNEAALARKAPRAALNLVWIAIENDDLATARRLLAHVDDAGERDLAMYRHLYDLMIAACAIDLATFRRRRAELDAALATEGSLHRWVWARLFCAKSSSLMDDWDAARSYLVEAKLVAASTPPALLHATLAFLERATTRPDERGDPEMWAPDADEAQIPRKASPVGAAARELSRRPVLGLLYRSICRAGAAGVAKEQLVWDVWSVRYDPVRHDERLYKSLSRLRRTLEGAGSTVPERLLAIGDRYVIETVS